MTPEQIVADANRRTIAKVVRYLPRRSDGRYVADHEFNLYLLRGHHAILAGCRCMTIPEFRRHTASYMSNYDDERRGNDKYAATNRILDYFQACLDAALPKPAAAPKRKPTKRAVKVNQRLRRGVKVAKRVVKAAKKTRKAKR